MTSSQAQLDLGMHEPICQGTRLPRLTTALEHAGAVYTRQWVADLILDLVGFRAEVDLADRCSVEPSAGAGAFLVPMIRRLLASVAAHGRPLADAQDSILAYELDATSASRAVAQAELELRRHGAGLQEAGKLAKGWV